MVADHLARHAVEGEPDVPGPILFHLGKDRLAHHVARLELVREALAVRVKQDRALAAAGLGNQEGPAGLGGVERGRVDLDVVHVVELDAMGLADAAAVAGEAAVVGGVLVEAADAARCQQGVAGPDGERARGVAREDAGAARVRAALFFYKKVLHHGVLHDADVGQAADLGEKCGRNRLARRVLVVDDAVATVGALARVVKIARIRAVEVHAVAHQLADHVAARPDHGVHALGPALIVAGAHRVVEPGVVVVVVAHHADTTLREHGVAVVDSLLGEHDHPQVAGEVQGREEPRHAAADDRDVAVDRAVRDRRVLLGTRLGTRILLGAHDLLSAHVLLSTHRAASSSMRSSGAMAPSAFACSSTSPAPVSSAARTFSGPTMAMLGQMGGVAGK